MDLFGKFLGDVLFRNLSAKRWICDLSTWTIFKTAVKASETHLLCPGKNDIFLQQVGVVQVFEDDGNARQQLNLVQLHDALKSSQQILLGFLVVVAELKKKRNKKKKPDVIKPNEHQPNEPLNQQAGAPTRHSRHAALDLHEGSGVYTS